MSNATTGERVWPMTLTSEQAAQFLAIGRTTFFAMKAAGRLPDTVLVGMKRRKYRLEDLKKWAESLK